ncbi:MAG: FAD:protein FMN transferase [Bacteroidota bacterium]
MKRLFLLVLPLLLTACQQNGPSDGTDHYQVISGQTMGTTYNISYADVEGRNLKKEIDALLVEVNLDLSTYIDTSLISRFNDSEKGLQLQENYVSAHSPHRHFLMNYYRAKEVYAQTAGSFNPTVMPLVNYWGFGKERKKVEEVDQEKIDSLLQLVNFDAIQLDEATRFLGKGKAGVQLDFSAIAKGYGVDVVCELLDQEDINNYMVEIGGEVRAKGKSQSNDFWKIGINTPKADAGLGALEAIVYLKNSALASSGDYRNYHEVNGIKYGHTIDPKTGRSRENRLLSASIFAEDCMTADAYATACMVMGQDKAFALVEKQPKLEAYFIYGDDEGQLAVKYTDGLKDWLISTNGKQ